jgi:hypothetical protein
MPLLLCVEACLLPVMRFGLLVLGFVACVCGYDTEAIDMVG